ncbi:PT domain-containing protein [Bradyrhizobium ontarionense]|uniref:PT domain-containing protein n=1 Tax=Bradyrhizobium ontarionense TaxID=2898149 RepID=A0ABY3RJV5_9BRAD|nr:PT domain-containing protein [Bradyrhizobium sp. A19]UFZ07730.1 PT domain-containing protein [Bradyrhizobium sp. A19]
MTVRRAILTTVLSMLALTVSSLSVPLLTVPAHAKGPFGAISAAGWSGGAYTDDKTGQFTSCIASASYQSGITFGVLATPTYSWALAFIHPGWSLSPGQKFPIVLSFDGKSTYNAEGAVWTANMVAVPMPNDSSLIKAFRAARTMSAFAQGNLFQFKLNGTAVLLPSLANCVRLINAGGLAAATNFTVQPSAAPAQRPTPPPTATASVQPSRPQGDSPELQLEAMQIASNFILKAALAHPSILGGGEKPVWLTSGGVAWKADNATGFVRIVPPERNVDGLEVTATIVGNDARDCKGKFISARNSELVDSAVVFRGMSSCEDSEKSDIAEYFIFPRKAGGFVLFSVVTPTRPVGSGGGQQLQTHEEANANFRKAAYTSIGK